jgi:hypothetical protein
MPEVPQTANADEEAAKLGRLSRASAKRGAGWDGWVLALAIGGIVAAPYATLTLPYRSALKTQGFLVLAFALIPLVAGLLRRGWWRRILAAPRFILVGIVMFVSATLLGAAVGLLRANDHAFVAGQVLSMGLLPLGVVAGLALAGGNLWRGYVLGIVGSVGVASCVHLGCWVFGVGVDPAYARFFFHNKVSPASAALIAVNLALAAALWERRWVRWASLPATVAMLLVILGSAMRSLWLVTAPSVIGVVLASSGLRRLVVHRVTRRIGLAALVAVAVFVGLTELSSHSHENSPRSVFSRLANEASFLVIRARTLTQLVGGGVSQHPDDSLVYRAEETRFLLETFRAAPLPAKVFGHGLGFTFASKNLGVDEADHLAFGHVTNYIHNYYVFLLVKLGLFGGVAVVLTLALWTAWSLRAALACSHEPAKTFLLAATAAWTAGLVWSLACPEIVDFRMAPLWGYLLAASADAAHRDR